MENTLKIVFVGIIFLFAENTFCQSDKAFCEAIFSSRFNKAERIFNKQVKKNNKGYVYQDSGWGIATTYYTNYEFLVNWLKKQDCVEDAIWNKFQLKAAIYPSYSIIGARFKTKKGIVEKCFMINEGTTGQINVLGWRIKIAKHKKKLVISKMFDCEKFIEQQQNCKYLQ